MDIDYDIDLDDFDSADYIDYSDEFYSRDMFPEKELHVEYWYVYEK